MKYNQPYGVTDPNAPYINGNPSTGTMGSIPPAASIEYPQREIMTAINSGGYTPDNADLTQLAQAIQSGVLHYGADSGSANNYSVNLTPVPTLLRNGMRVRVKIANDNTGPSTLNVNGLGIKPINMLGAALKGGELKAPMIASFDYDGAAWQLINPASTTSPALFNQPKALFTTAAIPSIPFATYMPMPLTLIEADYFTPTITGGNTLQLPAATYLFMGSAAAYIVVGPQTQVAYQLKLSKNGTAVAAAMELTQLLASQNAMFQNSLIHYMSVLPTDNIQFQIGGGTTYAADMVSLQSYAGVFAALRIGP